MFSVRTLGFCVGGECVVIEGIGVGEGVMAGECISVGEGGVVGDGGVESADDLVGSVPLAVFTAGEELIQVLVDIVGCLVPQQLRYLAHALQQVGRYEPIEELEVELVQRLHRKGNCLARRHLNSIIIPSSPFPSTTFLPLVFPSPLLALAGHSAEAIII